MKNDEKTKEISFSHNDINTDLYELYKNSSYLAVDTEAMGLIHGRDRCTNTHTTSYLSFFLSFFLSFSLSLPF